MGKQKALQKGSLPSFAMSPAAVVIMGKWKFAEGLEGLWVEPWPLTDDNCLHWGPLLFVSFVCFSDHCQQDSLFTALFYILVGKEIN